MHKHTAGMVTMIAALACGAALACSAVLLRATPRASTSAHRTGLRLLAAASPARSTRPSKADWQKIRSAAHLRRMALGQHRTALYRRFTAFLGLSELVTLHPLRRGRCTLAVSYLYDNLLDLHAAFPGEHWNPLRRAVAHEPSIGACRPLAKPSAGTSSGALIA